MGKKPAIIIANDFSVWVGNSSDAHLDLKGVELFGFGRGAYEQKIVCNLLEGDCKIIKGSACSGCVFCVHMPCFPECRFQANAFSQPLFFKFERFSIVIFCCFVR